MLAASVRAGSRNISDFKDAISTSRARLRERYFETGRASDVLKHTALHTDQVLRELWQQLDLPASIALVAVGGYGRGRLFPYSDVDVLVLAATDLNAGELERIEILVSTLWDVGLEVGHSVRTVQQCLDESQRDVTVQTTLMEARLVAGSSSLFGKLRKALSDQLDMGKFVNAKLLEQQQRHARFNDTASNLEPNIKEGPGGLRDLQMILWTSGASGLGNTWQGVNRSGMLTREEVRQARRHERFLEELRVRLHYFAGRREDRLLFDAQVALAADLGYRDSPARRASEQLMQLFYQSAKAITLFNSLALQSVMLHLSPHSETQVRVLSEHFSARGELLELRSARLFELHPSTLIEAFLVLQQHPALKGFSTPTARAIWHALPLIDARFRTDSVNRQYFMNMLRHPSGVTHALRRMNQYGVLGKYIPAFGRIVGRMQHDLFHVYTVDHHILTVVRNLRRFAIPEMAHEYPLCSRLMAEFERPEVLYLAGLFHDIAKGRGGDHSLLGRRDALRFCRNHGVSSEDTELVVWLVEKHLFMSAIAQKQDLSDPAVVQTFAAQVGSDRRLVALYLLTVADIRGTSPKVWNAWKARLLETLFRATRGQLLDGTLQARDGVQTCQVEAMAELRKQAIPIGVEAKFWSKLDDSYFLRHDGEEVAWHTRLLNYRVDSQDCIVKARLSEMGEGIQVLVYTADEKMLFARICSFFETVRFSIVEAKIYTTRHGYALDSFLIMDPFGEVENYRDVMSYLEHELARMIQERAPLPPPTQGRISRQLRNFPITPTVQLHADERGNMFYLNLVAGDRPGLLSRVARVLVQYQINLHNAKINTLGERAEDTFLVTGATLSDTRAVIRLESDLIQALQG
jgi:[protein-PII] uridylyltransferase